MQDPRCELELLAGAITMLVRPTDSADILHRRWRIAKHTVARTMPQPTVCRPVGSERGIYRGSEMAGVDSLRSSVRPFKILVQHVSDDVLNDIVSYMDVVVADPGVAE